MDFLPGGILYALPYIFSEISTCFYHFKRIIMRYYQDLKKEVYYSIFEEMLVTRDKALQNLQPWSLFTLYVEEDEQ